MKARTVEGSTLASAYHLADAALDGRSNGSLVEAQVALEESLDPAVPRQTYEDHIDTPECRVDPYLFRRHLAKVW